MRDRCDSIDYSYRSRPRFSHGIVKGLNIALILCGIICVGMGVAILTIVLTLTCTAEIPDWYRRSGETPKTYPDLCRYTVTLLSPGIWAGLEIFSSGVIGVTAAVKKTKAMIICMLVFSLLTAFASAAGCGVAIAGNYDYYYMYNPYPLSLHVLDSLLAFFCCVAFIISWITFGFALYALCNCNRSSQRCEESSRYQRLVTEENHAPCSSGHVNSSSNPEQAASGNQVHRVNEDQAA